MKNALIENGGSVQVSFITVIFFLFTFSGVLNFFIPPSNIPSCFLNKLNFFFFQSIKEIPDDLKAIYKTVWEISQKVVLQMAADRGAFIDQSQSLNIHIAEPNYGKLTSMHFHAWKLVSINISITSRF